MRSARLKACRVGGRRVGFQSLQALGFFPIDPKVTQAEQIIIQVKGGKPGVKDVRGLRGVLDREQAAMAVLISLQPPTRDMLAEPVSSGFYEHKTIHQVTPCATGTYILLPAPPTRHLRTVGRVR